MFRVLLAVFLVPLASAQHPGFCRNASVPITNGVDVSFTTDIRTAVVDRITGIIYYPLITGEVLRLTTDPLPFKEAGNITTGEVEFFSSAIHSGLNMAYFATGTGKVVRVDTATFEVAPPVLDFLAAGLVEEPSEALYVSLVDEVNNMGYFASQGGAIIKVDLVAWSVVASTSFTSFAFIKTAAIHTTGGYAYFVTNNPSTADQNRVLRLNLATFTEDGRKSFSAANMVATASALDGDSQYFYFTSFREAGSPRLKLFRIKLTDFAAPADVINMDPSDPIVHSIIVNPGQMLYLGSDSESGVSRVIGVSMSDWVRTGAIQLDATEVRLFGGVSRPSAGWGVFACRAQQKIVVIQFDPDPCNYTTCDECNTGCSCGWNGRTQSCLAGDPNGDFYGTSSGDEWDYYDCPNCRERSSCASCNANWKCGWCAEDQMCLRGEAASPMVGEGVCPATSWDKSPDTNCPMCSQYTECGTCTVDARCGWCPTSQTCFRGDGVRPFENTTACPRWRFDFCHDCASYSDCSSCQGDARGDCGWCAKTSQCLEGIAGSPIVGSCSRWHFLPGGNACADCSLSTCASCIDEDFCGYCASAVTCVEGDAAEAFQSVCSASDWHFDVASNPCIDCAAEVTGVTGDCTNCSDTAGCGWCAEDETCSRGDSSSPYGSSCPATAYNYGLGSCRDCEQYLSCGTCTAAAGCGWCPVEGMCSPGDALASYTSGACPSWAFGSCPACASYAGNCSVCTKQAECGFCESSQMCMDMSAAATCPDGFESDNCRHCELRGMSCGACVADGCGWCPQTNLCLPGDAFAYNASSCGSAWRTPSSTCTPCNFTSCSTCTAPACRWCNATAECVPADLATCTAATSCECADANCRTCDDPWTCGECQEDFILNGTTCIPLDLCTGTSCSECTAVPGCGWCHTSQTCVAGDAESSPLCSDVYTTTCPNCAEFNSGSTVFKCDACIESAFCGWCGFGIHGSCVEGLPGSSVDSCAVGNYSYDTCRCFASECSDCLLDDSCGWCSENSTCGGVGEGCPGECPAGPEPPLAIIDPCGAHGKCSDCVKNNCGWHEGDDKCYAAVDGADLATARIHCPDLRLALLIVAAILLCCMCLGAITFLYLRSQVEEEKPSKPLTSVGVGERAVVPPVLAPLDPTPTAVVSPQTSAVVSQQPSPQRLVMKERQVIPAPYQVLAVRDTPIDDELAMKLVGMEEVLLRADLSLVRGLVKVAQPNEMDELTRALVCDFMVGNVAHALTFAFIDDDRDRREHEILPADGSAMRAVAHTSNIMGMRYLYRHVRPSIVESLTSTRLEMNQPGNAIQIRDAVERFVVAILNSEAEVPRFVRSTCYQIKSSAPSDTALQTDLLGRFVLEQFIGSAIATPATHGLIQDPVDNHAHLAIIAKVLSAMCSSRPLDGALAPHSLDISKHKPAMEEFLHRLAGVDPALLPEEDVDKMAIETGRLLREHGQENATIVEQTPPHVRDEALVAIYNFVNEHLDSLRSAMGADRDKETTEAVVQKPFDHLKDELFSLDPDDANLLEMLLSDDLAIVSALCDVTPAEAHYALCDALVDLFEANEAAVRLIKILASREVRQAKTAQSLYREMRMCGKVMSRHSSLIAHQYRVRVLSPTINAICSNPLAYEADPSLITAPYSAKDNLRNVLHATGELLENIFNSLDEAPVPVQMRDIGDHLLAVVGDRFPDLWHLGPGRYFFHRFICQGIAKPHAHGIGDVPSEDAKRALRLINSIILKLVNGLLFGVEQRWMRSLNQFVESNCTVMQEFLVELSDKSAAGAGSPIPADIDDTSVLDSIAYIRQELLHYVDNADFCYYYHFYHFYHTDRSDDEEEYVLMGLNESNTDVQAFNELAVIFGDMDARRPPPPLTSDDGVQAPGTPARAPARMMG